MLEIESYTSMKTGTNRSFAFVFAFVFLLIGFWPLVANEFVRIWPIAIAVGLIAIGLLKPNIVAIPNRLWGLLGIFLGKITTPVVMFCMFAIIIVPTGLVLRIFGKDTLGLKFDSASKSYWMKRDEPPGSMKNQF